MKLKSNIKTIFLVSFSLILTYIGNAQSIGIGSSINYNSNGINIFFTNETKSGKWNYDAGLRITTNNLNLKGNDKNNFLYQSGYANSFGEYFSFNFRGGRQLLSCSFFQLDAMANLHLSYQSSVRALNIYEMGSNKSMNSGRHISKRGTGIELTAGLKGIVHLSEKVNLILASGWGLYHSDHKWPDKAFETWNTAKKRNIQYAIVGIDGLPMLSFAVTYKLPGKPPP